MPWSKKKVFNATMGAYDNPGIFETIGIFMLSLKGRKYDSKYITLYRNDGLNTSTKVVVTHHHFKNRCQNQF